MGVTSSGLRYPEPTEAVTQGALAIRNLAEDVTTRGARLLGGIGMVSATLPAGGGTLGLTASSLNVAAAAYPRIIVVTLVETLSSNTTWVGFSIRQAGTNLMTFRASATQHTVRGVWTELLPANTARAYDATITSSAAAAVYNTAGLAELTAIGYLAA